LVGDALDRRRSDERRTEGVEYSYRAAGIGEVNGILEDEDGVGCESA
jgi:hypothetical protein